MPKVRNRIFYVIQEKQNGKCHRCRRNITLSVAVESHANGRGYYDKPYAEKLHIV